MKKLLSIGFFVLIAAYALFQARSLVFGPRVSIITPERDSVVDAGAVVVSGTTRSVSTLMLDDRRVFTDTEGHFEEKLIMHSGINIIEVAARDRFGRETVEFLRISAK